MVHWPGDDAEGAVETKKVQNTITYPCPRTGVEIADWDFQTHVAQFSTKIMENLYLGNNSNAQDLEQLNHSKDKITHILNIQRNGKAVFEGQFKYLVLDLDDLPAERLLDIVPAANDFIKDAMASGKVLVHCDTGKSRAAAIVIAYLMQSQKLKFKKALQKVNEGRKAMFQSNVSPNHGFVRQLRQYEKQIL